MILYDKIGDGYSKTRLADPRIVDVLTTALALPRKATILDVGAGNGKYSHALAERGYKIIALEPSEVMRSQAVQHEHVTWLDASAEDIPLAAHSADGAFIALALHHFADRQKALREIARVVGAGPIVIFTFEPSKLKQFWLADYFPRLGREIDTSFSRLADVGAEVKSLTGATVESVPFPLPRDLVDKFAAACWSQPEEYLKPQVRNGISSFSLMPPSDVAAGLCDLAEDLKSGKWDKRYGHLRQTDSYDIGYRFIIIRPAIMT